MLTLDEAIAHARKVAKEQRDKSEQYRGCISDYFKYMFKVCQECAEEYEQLADWLEELKDYREEEKRTCKNCKHRGRAEYEEPCSNCRCNHANYFEWAKESEAEV